MKKKVIIKVPMNREMPQNKAMTIVARVLRFIVLCQLQGKRSDFHSIVAQNKSRAMTIAVGFPGVVSASLTGKEENELEVIGDEIDPVELTNKLREVIGFAEVLHVSAVGETKKATESKNEPQMNCSCSNGGVPHFQVFECPRYEPSCFFF